MADTHLFGLPDAAIGPITAAIVAGAIALISMIITKEQKTSEFRQAWIDELRKDTATFISSINALRDIDRMNPGPEKHWETSGEIFRAANEALMRIRLRLNPEELPSQEMLETMGEMEAQFCQGVEPSTPKLAGLEVKLLMQSQRILKTEWDRVRSGETAFWSTKWVTVAFVAYAMMGILRRLHGS